jgi:hypothetical protein
MNDLLASSEALTRVHNEDQGLLPRDVSLSSIETLVYMAGRIHRLAATLLGMGIDQAIGIQSTPPTPLPSSGFLFSVKSFRDHRENLHDTFRHTYPASEVAEFRTVRALWRLQLYYFQPISFAISLHEILSPGDDQIRSSIWGELKSWEIHEMRCVYGYLRTYPHLIMGRSPCQPNDCQCSIVYLDGSTDRRGRACTQMASTRQAVERRSPADNSFHGYCYGQSSLAHRGL